MKGNIVRCLLVLRGTEAGGNIAKEHILLCVLGRTIDRDSSLLPIAAVTDTYLYEENYSSGRRRGNIHHPPSGLGRTSYTAIHRTA